MLAFVAVVYNTYVNIHILIFMSMMLFLRSGFEHENSFIDLIGQSVERSNVDPK